MNSACEEEEAQCQCQWSTLAIPYLNHDPPPSLGTYHDPGYKTLEARRVAWCSDQMPSATARPSNQYGECQGRFSNCLSSRILVAFPRLIAILQASESQLLYEGTHLQAHKKESKAAWGTACVLIRKYHLSEQCQNEIQCACFLLQHTVIVHEAESIQEHIHLMLHFVPAQTEAIKVGCAERCDERTDKVVISDTHRCTICSAGFEMTEGLIKTLRPSKKCCSGNSTSSPHGGKSNPHD
jgi:hypothetical protein